MKKVMSVLLVVLMTCIGISGLAEVQGSPLTLTGAVVARQSVSVSAPFGGMIGNFSVKAGDTVQLGDALFTISTTAVYAPCDGIVRGLRAQPGDDAAYVEDRYGALVYIEPASPYTVSATTRNAYDKNENRIIHVGEKVYLKNPNKADHVGEGFVISVNGSSYTVEVTGGNLEAAETVRIYRTGDYSGNSRIGDGRTAQMAPVPVTAQGSVLAVHVREEASVKRGELLVETVTGAFAGLTPASNTVSASEAGIVEDIQVTPGTKVTGDQVLATILPWGGMQIAVGVSETDLYAVHVDDAVSIEFIAMKDQEPVAGTVASISALSNTQTGDAEYTVYINFETGDWLRLGMSAAVSFGNK